MQLKIKDNENLVRDSSNMAILCKNTDVLRAHDRKIIELKEKEQQKNEINNLKRDVSEMKEMLQLIIQRLN